MPESPVVQISQGQLQGKTVHTAQGKHYFSFQGIPYAKPPIGSLRFKDPQPAKPWSGVRDATEEGNQCAQEQFDHLDQKHKFVGGEDCLYINVYTPSIEDSDLPVLFLSHAGLFQYGSGNSDEYGPEYLVDKDVVLVTCNYRLGPLGFLCLHTPEVPGNAGLKDQVMALKWVKENIKSFGGNPEDITVFGSGSGAASASFLTVSPSSKDLIQKVILQSGTAIHKWTLAQRDPLETARQLATSLSFDVQDPDDILTSLEAVSVEELIHAASKMYELHELFEDFNVFEPIVEFEYIGVEPFLNESPYGIIASGRQAKVPTIIGSNSAEALFLLGLPNFQIETDLRKFIPKSFKLDINSNEALEISKRLHDFYFGGGPINLQSLEQYMKLLTDCAFAADVDRYITLVKHTSNVPLYQYRFSYFGEGNAHKKLGDSFGIQGAGHLDELGYLFHVNALKDVKLSSDDIRSRERLVEMWTNFAKFGKPIPEESSLLPCSWLPVDRNTRYYLEIGNELKLGTDPDFERMNLWRDLYGKYFKVYGRTPTPTPATPHKTTVSEAALHNVDSTEEMRSEEDIVIEKIEKVLIEEERNLSTLVQTNTKLGEIYQDLAEKQGLMDIDKPDSVGQELRHNGNGIANGIGSAMIRANDPPEDDLPRNIGVNRFVSFFESLGGGGGGK